MRRNKYNNIKTKGYDSKKESKRAIVLKKLQKEGHISHLQEQKVFELQPSFKVPKITPPFGLKTIRSIKYVTDFYYYDNNKKVWVAEDVKGYKTDVYLIKAKIFQYIYRDILFIES